MNGPNYRRTRFACFYAYLAMSSVFTLPPLLFVTFHETYGISYTLLGTLVLINFLTQLSIDLIFSFFPEKFNIKWTVRLMPLLTGIGLTVYALSPFLFPSRPFLGLAIGTVIFSVAAGLCEVLISPVVAAIPSEHPDRDMSLLHSLYGWGVVSNVVLATLFFKIFGTANWQYHTLFLAVLPLIASVLFFLSPIPPMNTSTPAVKGAAKRTTGIFLCFVCIFLGSASENAMTNWISGYMENALHIPKAAGDILGMAVFALLLASCRTLYAKYGKNILNTLLFSMAGAAVFYIVAGSVTNTIVSFLACVLIGFCTSMLWPGTLILMEEKIPDPGVAAYALMAAGGDFGASVAPQLLGVIVDKVKVTDFALNLSATRGMTPDEVGLRVGVLIAAVFPLIGTVLLLFVKRYFSKQDAASASAD